MTPERAISLLRDVGVRAANLRAECRTDRYDGAWVVFARVGDYERPVTQTRDPGLAASWINRYAALES